MYVEINFGLFFIDETNYFKALFKDFLKNVS